MWLADFASCHQASCSNKPPQTGPEERERNPTMPSIHPQIVNKDGCRRSRPLVKMTAGGTERSNNDPVSPADPAPFIPPFHSPCHCSERSHTCSRDQVRSQVGAPRAALCAPSRRACRSGGGASRLPVDTDGPLCSSWQSSTSGQINYQVICHYLLSKGLGRSDGGEGSSFGRGRSGEGCGRSPRPPLCVSVRLI